MLAAPEEAETSKEPKCDLLHGPDAQDLQQAAGFLSYFCFLEHGNNSYLEEGGGFVRPARPIRKNNSIETDLSQPAENCSGKRGACAAALGGFFIYFNSSYRPQVIQ